MKLFAWISETEAKFRTWVFQEQKEKLYRQLKVEPKKESVGGFALKFDAAPKSYHWAALQFIIERFAFWTSVFVYLFRWQYSNCFLIAHVWYAASRELVFGFYFVFAAKISCFIDLKERNVCEHLYVRPCCCYCQFSDLVGKRLSLTFFINTRIALMKKIYDLFCLITWNEKQVMFEIFLPKFLPFFLVVI